MPSEISLGLASLQRPVQFDAKRVFKNNIQQRKTWTKLELKSIVLQLKLPQHRTSAHNSKPAEEV